MDQTRRFDCGSKADCSLKYTEDVRLADIVSNRSYRYLNNISWEMECFRRRPNQEYNDDYNLFKEKLVARIPKISTPSGNNP